MVVVLLLLLLLFLWLLVYRAKEEAANASLKAIFLLLLLLLLLLFFLWFCYLNIKFLLNEQQELLLGEQTPSPSLSRSSSVSSVLMVSNVTFVIIIDYFHVYLFADQILSNINCPKSHQYLHFSQLGKSTHQAASQNMLNFLLSNLPKSLV